MAHGNNGAGAPHTEETINSNIGQLLDPTEAWGVLQRVPEHPSLVTTGAQLKTLFLDRML